MQPTSNFSENTFTLEVSSKMIKHYGKALTKILETTPINTDLRSLESAILLRMMAVLIGKTVLRTDLTIQEYLDLEQRIQKCYNRFQEDYNGNV